MRGEEKSCYTTLRNQVLLFRHRRLARGR